MRSNLEEKQIKDSFNCYREKEYIKENLLYYIEKEKKHSRSIAGLGWHIYEDRDTQLRYLLLDYVLEHFDVYELFSVFFQQDSYRLNSNNITEARQHAIENINNDDSFTPEEAKRLKRKVWDMNPILFGLILEFIHDSGLFWDYDKEDIVLPDFD